MVVTDLADAPDLLVTAVRAGTTKPIHIHPAATTESAKEKTDILGAEVTTGVAAVGNGIATAAHRDAIEMIADHAETEGSVICLMTAEALAEESSVTVLPPLPLLLQGEAPVLPRNPRSRLLI